MSNVSKINDYDIADATARAAHNGLAKVVSEAVSDFGDRITALEGGISNVDKVPSQISEFSLTPTPTDIPITTTNGVSYNLTSFTHKESLANNINGKLSLVKTIRNSSGTVLSTTTLLTTPASESSVEVSVKDNNTITQEQSITYTLSGVNKNGEEIKKEKTIYFYFPHYVGISILPSLSMAVFRNLEQVNSRSLAGYRKIVVKPYTSPDGERSISQYIWIATTTPIKNVTCDGGFVDLIKDSGRINSDNGGVYYSYRSEDEIIKGEYTLNIIV